ncbi:MAG: hypothetical protein KatS3mg030_636 [Saprospiraceae bacterium]|nr:MAG: hypothetical protein KatS3mg030_636 [Saprospiraceae bacterium]
MPSFLKARHLFYLLVFATTFLVRHHPFFWDTIQLGSKHAHFFFENNFSSLILPAEIDSGHPPTFGLYLAAVWKLFGKTLPVSHFAMLPFLVLIVWAAAEIGKYIVRAHRSSWLLLLLFADPVFASQSVLVSPDIVLVSFFLLALLGHFRQSASLLMLGFTGLMLISTRGMMVAFALLLFEALVIFSEHRQELKSRLTTVIVAFLPGAVLALAFLLFHWQQTGWLGYHPDSPWAPSFERVDFKGFLKNLLVLAWRLADFGRIILLALLGWLAWNHLRTGQSLDRTTRHILLLTLCLAIVLFPPLLIHKGLLGHRYLLPIAICLTFCFLRFIPTTRTAWNLYVFIAMLGLLSGNFWAYPQPIATGWDATLAHLPWYGVQHKMMRYIDDRKIPLEKIGTAFPMVGPRKFIELNGRQDGFVPYDLSRQCMVLYANVMNDFTKEELDELFQKWKPVVKFSEGWVTMILFENPAPCEN